jgi:hypothetical protein
MGWRRSLEGMEPWRRNTLKIIAVVAGLVLLVPLPSPFHYGTLGSMRASIEAAAWLTCMVLGIVAFFLWSTRPNF